jgi:CBS domain-containing protein
VTYLIVVNVLLGAFNLIPGFPLDGGRVFRSIIWRATGSVRRATEIAAAVGQLVGFGFIAWGILGVFDGDLLGGLWTAAIGLFLQNAAGSSVQQLALDQRLRSVRVRDAFTPDDDMAAPELTISELIEDHILGRKRRAVVVTEGGRLVGIVTIGDLQRVPPEARGRTTVREVMTGLDSIVTTSPGTSLRDAADVLAHREFDQLPVVEDGRPLGAITRADIMREFQIREALDLGERPSQDRGELLRRPQPGQAG